MANENQSNRTQLTDLPATEQEMTAEEMAQVQGGTTHKETRSNPTVAAALPPPDSKNQTPLPPAPGKTSVPL